MKAGNVEYKTASDLPAQAPVFPLSGALLLPGGQLPLNIFESRYLKMFEDAIIGDRLIAMIQPVDQSGAKEKASPQKMSLENTSPEKAPLEQTSTGEPALYDIGCIGRITAFQESGDGRYMVNLTGICRYKLASRVATKKNYNIYEIECFESDLIDAGQSGGVDRDRLLKTFRDYLEANQMDADWESVEETDTDQLVNALCMMSPYGPAEKQALLEANDLKLRAETLIAITEFELAKSNGSAGGRLQ